MTRNSYDEQRAVRLVPLLRSITKEIQERAQSIDRLEHERKRQSPKGEERERARRLREIDAELAMNRRQLRVATREIERLGCALDDQHPLRVLIPGADGEFDRGFAWSPLDEPVPST